MTHEELDQVSFNVKFGYFLVLIGLAGIFILAVAATFYQYFVNIWFLMLPAILVLCGASSMKRGFNETAKVAGIVWWKEEPIE